MKSEKKILASLLTLSTVFILFGCGSSVSTMNEKGAEEITDTVESGVSVDETIDKVEEIKEGEEEITDKPAEATASPTPTATPEPTSTPSPSPATPTPEPHVHQYTEAVTRQATCAEAGEKTLTCSCGDVKVEAIPATGEHIWIEGTIVVHHEELGHVETVLTQTGVGETRHEYECANCGACFDTPEAKVEHCKATGDRNHATCGTIIHDYPGEPIYEETQVWHVDQEAWDEVVSNGIFTCQTCGATK